MTKRVPLKSVSTTLIFFLIVNHYLLNMSDITWSQELIIKKENIK